MSALEVNKIFASFLLAIILLIVINFVGDLIVDKENNEFLETAYKIEIDEVEILKTDSSKSELVSELISPLLASASIEKGEKIYKKCGACHTYKKDGASKMGPRISYPARSPWVGNYWTQLNYQTKLVSQKASVEIR